MRRCIAFCRAEVPCPMSMIFGSAQPDRKSPGAVAQSRHRSPRPQVRPAVLQRPAPDRRALHERHLCRSGRSRAYGRHPSPPGRRGSAQRRFRPVGSVAPPGMGESSTARCDCRDGRSPVARRDTPGPATPSTTRPPPRLGQGGAGRHDHHRAGLSPSLLGDRPFFTRRSRDEMPFRKERDNRAKPSCYTLL